MHQPATPYPPRPPRKGPRKGLIILLALLLLPVLVFAVGHIAWRIEDADQGPTPVEQYHATLAKAGTDIILDINMSTRDGRWFMQAGVESSDGSQLLIDKINTQPTPTSYSGASIPLTEADFQQLMSDGQAMMDATDCDPKKGRGFRWHRLPSGGCSCQYTATPPTAQRSASTCQVRRG